jgi:hypothetical protein
MALTTSLAGRVRNTSLPKSHSLLPLLEAVVNGLQAIDTRFGPDVDQGCLTITIGRDSQQQFDLPEAGRAVTPITSFTVTDNGEGFTPSNMASFETLDSDYKAEMGCRGVGRLLWLKAFDRVSVRSAYASEDGERRALEFRFSIDRDVEYLGTPDKEFTDCGSIVHLDGFKKPFQRNAPKTAEAIARAVFEHCIWYFIRPGGAPTVTVVDDEVKSLNELMAEFVFSDLPSSSVIVGGQEFLMTNLCLRAANRNATPRLFWCAASRVVMEDNLTGRIPGLYGRLKDNQSAEFTYACYLSSDYLDANVRSDRTAFDIVDNVSEGVLTEDISLEQIRSVVLAEVENLLSGPLATARDEGKQRVNEYVSGRAPRYRPVLSRLVSLGVTVDPSIRDAELEALLHRTLQQLEAKALAEGQEVLGDAGFDRPEDYDERLREYLETITDINMSDLAAYVSRRKVIIDALARLIRSDEHGRYSREDAIHSLLMPMRKDSNEIGADASNLWILDERLAFHDYLASDRQIRSMPITDSESTMRPDVLTTRIIDAPVLASDGETMPLSSIVVIEIKRPLRNDATADDRDPIQQALEYVKRVRAGTVFTASGRPIPASDRSPAFCYVVADLTPTMVTRCEFASLRRTHDGLGYFGFNEPLKAYIEVMSFDGLVNSATERNRAFFDKLGLPST